MTIERACIMSSDLLEVHIDVYVIQKGGRSCFGTSDIVTEQVWVGRVQRDGRTSVYCVFGLVRGIDRCVRRITWR